MTPRILCRSRRALAGAALLAGLMLAAGCGGGGTSATGGGTSSSGGPPVIADTTPPSISGASVSPGALQFAGGQVVVQASVSDAGGVSGAWAVITRPDTTTARVDLTAAGGAYSGTWVVGANTDTSGDSLAYGVRVYASDKAGNESASGPLSFTIAGLEAPPAMPF